MRALLVKEDRLAASPLSRLFLVFCAMTMLPGYPILTGAVFVCLGLFYSVQGVKENRDVLYTLLLPVTRAEAVRAKFSFCIRIEAVGFGIMAALIGHALKDAADRGDRYSLLLPADEPLYRYYARFGYRWYLSRVGQV